MNAFVKYLAFYIGVAILCLITGGIVGPLLDSKPLSIENMFTGTYSIIISGVLFLIFILFMLLRISSGEKKTPLFKSSKQKVEVQQFFDSQWLTEHEMNKKYPLVTFKHLGSVKSGIPIRAELSGNDVRINMKDENWHAMVIGTTGSGKTAGFVSPCIQILGACKDKPCLVINDMKGELFRDHSEHLKKNGYNVIALDLRDTFSSTRWNPMEKAFNAFQRSLNLYSEIKIHSNKNPADLGLEILAPVYNREWYEFEGRAYPSRAVLENDLNAMKKRLRDDAYEDLNDVAITLCPQTSQGDSATWERGAKDFVLGTMLAMLEDSAFPELGMTREKFNLYNLYKICNLRDDDAENQFGSLSKYFHGRDKLSSAAQLAGPIVNNAPTTTRGYMGIVSGYLSSFADEGICFATSANEMDFEHFTDRPSALFIKVPDEKDTRHGIATMCILQLYKTLVATANMTTSLCLPRRVYFILDEFGNLPKIPKFDNIITVGRSRGISLFLVVQSYTQINIKYGDAVADTLKSNCNIHYFLGTTDAKTKEDFSLRCGTTSVDTTSSTKNKGKDSNSTSVTTNKTSVRLITVDELGLLKPGEIIVSMFKESAIRSTFTFAHKASHVYNMTHARQQYVPARFLNTEEVYYDIRLRNRKVLRDV